VSKKLYPGPEPQFLGSVSSYLLHMAQDLSGSPPFFFQIVSMKIQVYRAFVSVFFPLLISTSEFWLTGFCL